MKPSSPELRALLASRQFFAADLWTVTLADGTVLRYTSGDADISANGLLYSSGGLTGPYFDRSDNKAKCHWKVGTGTDTLLVDVLPGTAKIEGVYMSDAIRRGIFDGAEVMLERAYMPAYGDTRVGVLRYFLGRVAEIDGGASVATFSINSHLELLNLQLPRNIAQISCMNNLGDSVCGVNLASYMTTGTVGSTADTNQFECTISGSYSPGTFDSGKVVFTSGANNGVSVTVKICDLTGPDSVMLLGFLASAPAPGDTFNIYFGCNKSYTDGNGCPKFSNTARFRGLPFVPQPSIAV